MLTPTKAREDKFHNDDVRRENSSVSRRSNVEVLQKRLKERIQIQKKEYYELIRQLQSITKQSPATAPF